MQTWKPKIAETREACFSDGKIKTRFYIYPKEKGGLVVNVNGVEFTELRAVQENGSDNVMFLAHGKNADGTEYYDTMSPNGWAVMAHWGQAIAQFNGKLHGEAKARVEARKAACLTLGTALRKSVSATTMKATLKAEGYSDSEIDYAVYEIGKAEASKGSATGK